MARSQVRQRAPEYADPRDVAEWAQDLSTSHLECRDMRHSWRPRGAKFLPELGVYERVRRCSRCKTERRETLSEAGAVLSRSYNYPDGYQTQGIGRLAGDSLDALRLASLHRELDSNGKSKSNGKAK